MDLIVKKTSSLTGSVVIPSSKSHSIRAIFLSLLAKGRSNIDKLLDSEDTDDAIRVSRCFGAQLEYSNDNFNLTSSGFPFDIKVDEIFSGSSGITTCFVMPLLGLRKNPHIPIRLDCSEQMRLRPIMPLVNALTDLGLTIEYLNRPGVLPIAISGSLRGGKTLLNGVTSQYLSALLISLPCVENESEIVVSDLHERPYVEMTLNWLLQQGIVVDYKQVNNKDVYLIKGGQSYSSFKTTIKGDFSSASYLIAAGAITKSYLELENLDMNDSQGDKILVSILQEMGADIEINSKKLIIRGGKALNGLKIDARDIPDLLPTLSIIGTYAKGKTEIINVKQARLKETDRINSISKGLKLLGANIDEYDDGLVIYNSALKGNQVKGYGDHRTVMALSIAGLIADGTTVIKDGEAINKTFPDFVSIMQSLGSKIEIVDVNT